MGDEMRTLLERQMELERTIRDTVIKEFPSLDPDLAVDRYMTSLIKARRDAAIIVAQIAESMVSQLEEKACQDQK